MDRDELPDWERLLAAERHLQALVPGRVLVGGTAAALHAGHRKSLDGDHVLEDLRPRFDEVLAALEAAAGWQTSRVKRPVEILGRLDGMMTGIRQLRRTRPLETSDVPDVDLRTYKGLVSPWNDWSHLAARGRHWAAVLACGILAGGGR